MNVDNCELWICTEAIAVHYASYKENTIQRRILIETGEVVEFRYHHSIHFRTEDNIYCVLDEGLFYGHFKPYGKIYPGVKFANRAGLKDILKLNLYHKIKEEPK